jgi:hypothetical protein
MITGRPSNKRDPREKIFIAFEGQRTEPCYFKGLIRMRNHDLNMDILPLYRGPGREHESNPKSIANQICEYIEFRRDGVWSTDLFVEQMLTSARQICRDSEEKFDREMFKKMKHSLSREPDLATERSVNDPEGALGFCRDFMERSIGEPVNIDIPRREEWNDDYRCCMVVDRDSRSFTDEQCDYVRDLCEREKIMLIVTNPCFELWLLMHFETSRDRIEGCVFRTRGLKDLVEEIAGHRERDLDFRKYDPNVEKALAHLRKEGYCENLDTLLLPTGYSIGAKFNLGTNIGNLLDIILRQSDSGVQ